ncbi:phosphate acyltransferase PlsX [Eggerthellaceae bacterium zg-887]|uniref:phosphate acyltransferase PlsX n=1 Tax=Xiamenia xianingshaonis TaxID=2682776 RepID=UPI00140A75E0|nr:phosphate acyltransferase PlsX [Xiamenia xianingshaonis]NHM16125.1 phosphate acyltransferase PlsX [Xiamenia xianingshaonis]
MTDPNQPTRTLHVAVDAMGGDHAPSVVLEGVEAALAANPALSVALVGDADVVEPFAASHARCQAVVSTEVIGMDEHPAEAVRRKKDSSVVVGCRLVKEGRAEGFFSAGSTGACLAAGTLVIGRVKGVLRPALVTVVPSPVRPIVLGDIGANADCKPEYLVQFAVMESIYANKVLGIERPRAALLNIGAESTKGSQFAQAAYRLMEEGLDNFAGNAEGGDILTATYDVVVTDGFTGNVCLKTIEGTAKVLLGAVKGVMGKSTLTKLGALPLVGPLKGLKAQISPDTYGGAPLLGLKGALLVGHGSSNAQAICSGVLATAKLVEEGVTETIADALSASEKR